MNGTPKVVIIGGGISGLATAWWLHKASVDVTVLEEGPTPGGTMRTVRDNDWLIETGPNSALETTPLFHTLFRDVGLLDDLVYANEAGNSRYILRNGALHALPMSPPAFFKSRLWSGSAKLRLLAEPFIGRAREEETIAQFVRRRLGPEFLDYAINPFVAGVYAGNPEDLSVRAAFPKLYALEERYGGLIMGQIRGARERKKRKEQAKDRARMFSFRDGMQMFPEAIATKLGDAVLTGVSVRSIRENNDERRKEVAGRKTYTIDTMRGAESFNLEADIVITAVPSFVTASLIDAFDGPLASSLRSIFYPPVVEIFQGYRAADVRRTLDGFGYLIPEKEHRSILGTIWSSALFEGRAPSGHVAFTTFVGGARQPELTQREDGELDRIVRQEIASLMGTTADPVYTRITRWSRAIPQYRPGHLALVAEIEQCELAHPGIFISGNFRGGISVGDCIISSDRTARSVLDHIGRL